MPTEIENDAYKIAETLVAITGVVIGTGVAYQGGDSASAIASAEATTAAGLTLLHSTVERDLLRHVKNSKKLTVKL